MHVLFSLTVGTPCGNKSLPASMSGARFLIHLDKLCPLWLHHFPRFLQLWASSLGDSLGHPTSGGLHSKQSPHSREEDDEVETESKQGCDTSSPDGPLNHTCPGPGSPCR